MQISKQDGFVVHKTDKRTAGGRPNKPVLNVANLATLHYVEINDMKTCCIVISLSKIRDRDWSYMRHVICINNQCFLGNNIPGKHSCSRATVPGNIAGEHDQQDVIPCIRG